MRKIKGASILKLDFKITEVLKSFMAKNTSLKQKTLQVGGFF